MKILINNKLTIMMKIDKLFLIQFKMNKIKNG